MLAEELRAKYGTTFRLEAAGFEAHFRPMTFDEARTLSKQIERAPEIAFQLGIAACQACIVNGAEHFDALVEVAPLAFDLDGPGLAATLLSNACSAAAANARAAVQRWRQADRNLAEVAESLLAFKAFTGGEPSPAARAGALHLAEAFDHQKGLFKLVLGYMRAVSKKG